MPGAVLCDGRHRRLVRACPGAGLMARWEALGHVWAPI